MLVYYRELKKNYIFMPLVSVDRIIDELSLLVYSTELENNYIHMPLVSTYGITNMLSLSVYSRELKKINHKSQTCQYSPRFETKKSQISTLF